MAIQHILFPTDFSDPARYAGRYAAALARGTGARVTLLHAMMIPYPPGQVPPAEWLDLARRLAEEERARVDREFEAVLEAADFRDLAVRKRVVTGAVELEVLQALRDDPADLVVLGTHGRGMVGRAVLGGITTKVVRLSPRPVLAVRWPGARVRTPWGRVLVGPSPRGDGPRFARILTPLDGSAAAEGILAEVVALAKPFNAALTLLRVIERPAYPMLDVTEVQARAYEAAFRYLADVRAKLEGGGIPVATEVLIGDPAHAILEHAAKVEVDVIAMSTHGRSGLDRWLLGSVAEKVLSGSDVPVLVYRAWTPAKD
jgi:nucleotide-binding universal stress UspA family protein